MNDILQVIQSIQNRIYEIRGERVMLDYDLAMLYEVPTKVLNQAVKRNTKRFPEDFMFRLKTTEWQNVRSHFLTIDESENILRSQIVTSKGKGGTRYIPYAFTEQGVAMLSGIINSDKAINMNIAIMRAFIVVRKILLMHGDQKEQLQQIQDKLVVHHTQLGQIYDAMENLLDEKAAQRKWEERDRIGFKK